MSNLAPDHSATPCAARSSAGGVQVLPTRDADVGGLDIRRALPQRERRMVGAWCFFDHFGPARIPPDGPGLRVPPHPHIGLQTVTWLAAGEVLHRDSLDNEQLIQPGQLNLMTAGRGIAHSEETPRKHQDRLHGVQLWIALPDADRRTDPVFAHHAHLPVVETGGARATVFAGDFCGQRSPARMFSRLAGVEIHAPAPASVNYALHPEFEYAALIMEGDARLEDTPMTLGRLCYLGTGRDRLELRLNGGRLILLGGVPFPEEVLLWWNFVARRRDELRRAREAWESGDYFGAVTGFVGEPLTAPELD